MSKNLIHKNSILIQKHEQETPGDSENRFKILSNASFEAIFVSQNGICLDQNRAAETLFGYTSAEARGRHAVQWIAEQDRELVKKNILSANDKPYEVTALRKNGTTFPCEIQARMIKIKDRSLRITALRDITQRRQMEKEIRTNAFYLKTIMEQSKEGFCFLDAKAVIVKINKAMSNLLGLPEKEILGKFYYDFMDKTGRENAKKHLEMRYKGLSSIYEIDFIKPDGTRVPCRICGNPILDKNNVLTGTFGLVSDHSDIKQAREKLEKAVARANDASRAKSEFLANMSHEIRTPMNAILGLSDIMKSEIEDNNHMQYLSQIQASGKSLLTLLNDILELSRLEAGRVKLNYKTVSLLVIFNEIISIFSQEISKKGLEIVLKTDHKLPEYLMLDESCLRQMILNLLGNAVKFTESGSIKIIVSTRSSQENSNALDLIFSISDTGIGISREQKKNIFNIFEQQKGQDHARYGGTGIGLAITKRLAEMMGGSVYFEGEPGMGCTVTVTLKNVKKAFAADSSCLPKTSPAGNYAESKPLILIVDDMAVNRTILKAYMKKYDFRFIEAENGRQAVEIACRQNPDLVLMDIQMPVMNGGKAIRLLKCDDKTKNIPVIAVTASVPKNNAEKPGLMCDGYLEKPVKENDLIAKMAEFIKFLPKNPGREDKIHDLIPKTDMPRPIEVDKETLEKLPGLIQVLKTEFTARYEEINDMLIMDDVKKFAEDINHLCETHELQILSGYAETLVKHTCSYNVSEVMKCISEFPLLIKKINLLLKNENLNT